MNKSCIYHPQNPGYAFCKRCNGYICKDCIIVIDNKGYCKKCHRDALKAKSNVPQCINHPEALGISYCKKCEGYLCQQCLVVVDGKKYCKKCYTEYQLNWKAQPSCINHPKDVGVLFCPQCQGYLCQKCIIVIGSDKKCAKHYELPHNVDTLSIDKPPVAGQPHPAENGSKTNKKPFFEALIAHHPQSVYGFFVLFIGVLLIIEISESHKLYLILISWILLILFEIYWGNLPLNIDSWRVDLPNTFLELDFNSRKQALDFSWLIGSEKLSSFPIQTIAKSSSSAVFLNIAFSLILLDVIFFANRLTKCPSYSNNGVIAILILFSFPIFFLHKYYSSKSELAQVEMDENFKAKANKKLKCLGQTFVHDNYLQWIEETDKIAKQRALQEIQSHPDNDFTLFSANFAITPSNMPPTKYGVTYLFSNGFISVVSNIMFDIKTTSYTYTSENVPTFILNSSDDWSIEEFHYQDVVEVNYNPASIAPETIKNKNAEYPVEGILTLSLVNASKKEYPTTKNNSASFIVLAREKVRLAKQNSSR